MSRPGLPTHMKPQTLMSKKSPDDYDPVYDAIADMEMEIQKQSILIDSLMKIYNEAMEIDIPDATKARWMKEIKKAEEAV